MFYDPDLYLSFNRIDAAAVYAFVLHRLGADESESSGCSGRRIQGRSYLELLAVLNDFNCPMFP
jgi:hypothetical protein